MLYLTERQFIRLIFLDPVLNKKCCVEKQFKYKLLEEEKLTDDEAMCVSLILKSNEFVITISQLQEEFFQGSKNRNKKYFFDVLKQLMEFSLIEAGFGYVGYYVIQANNLTLLKNFVNRNLEKSQIFRRLFEPNSDQNSKNLKTEQEIVKVTTDFNQPSISLTATHSVLFPSKLPSSPQPQTSLGVEELDQLKDPSVAEDPFIKYLSPPWQ